MSVFASYCQAYARWKAAEEFITSHGYVSMTPAGYVQQLPHVSISQTYQKIMNRCAEQLGLTPSSRSRLIAGEPGGSIKDEMEELLGGG